MRNKKMENNKVLSYEEFCDQYHPRIYSDVYRKEMMEKWKIDVDAEYEATTRLQYKMYLDGVL